MPAVVLPRLIEEKFADLSLQVRRLWLYRGVSRAIIASIVAAALALLADRTFELSTAARCAMLVAWFAAVFLAAWAFVVRPLRKKLSTAEMASAIERQFPSLKESLFTAVQLSETGGDGHGSKPLIDLLLRDISHRTKRLNFERAAPSASAIRIAVLAGLLIGLVLATLFFVSGGSARVKRFLLPWHTPVVEVPFAVKVSSGSVLVKRGEAVTLTAFLTRLKPDAVLPETAVLLTRDKAGLEKKYPMTGDSQAAFHVTLPSVLHDFEYAVAAGEVASDWSNVTVADAVELAEGTAITMVPPSYASPPLMAKSIAGFAALEALQHSELQIVLKFSGAARRATLEWLPVLGNSVSKVTIPLTLNEDRHSATATLSVLDGGTLRLTVSGEQGLVTIASAAVKAIADAPPRFDKVVGISERPRSVQPGETIILEAAVVDDFKVDSLSVEYAINGGKPVLVPFTARDLGTSRAEGKHLLSFAGLVKDGDALTYRLIAADNRLVAKVGLKPQVITFPAKAWAALTISASAESLDQQDVLSQRDAVKGKLDEALAAANEARRLAEQVQRESGEKPMLTPEQMARVEKAREAAAAATKALEDAGRDAALTPELRNLAEAMRSVARDPLAGADDRLKRSEHEPTPKGRNDALTEAEAKLATARDRIEEIQRRNEELARNRLDKRRLEKLADEVSRLAADAEKVNDAKTQAEIQKKLQRARDELRDVIRSNEALRQGVETAASEEARKLAEAAEKLRGEQKALADAANRNEASAKAQALEGAAKSQDALNAEADLLRDRTRGPSKLQGEEPLAREPFEKAGEKLRNGDPIAAMTEQEKAARDLERLADSLEKAANLRKEPREAAKQLAKLQDELRERMVSAAKKPLTDDEKKRFQEQQAAIQKAVDRLETPPKAASSAQAKSEAQDRLQAAGEAMAKDQDPAAAQAGAAAALRKLAEKLPPREQRIQAAKVEIEKLLRDQDALQKDVDAKLKPYEARRPDEFLQSELAGKLAALAKQQAAIAERLSVLDAPGLEERRDRTTAAAKRAEDDLRKGLPQDIPASQADLRRRLTQLRTAIEGGTPADALADELARQQSRIAERLERGPPDAAQLGELQKLQRDVADRLGGVSDPDAAERLNRAKASTSEAARKFQRADDVDELRKKTRQAAKDLDELADQLSGAEADRQRVERLAKSRQERAEWSKANAGKATPPEEAAAIAGELERELDDLKKTRTGPAQQEKKAAVEALERLRRTPNAERAPALQKDAAEAMDQLAKKLTTPPPAKCERCPNDGDATGDAAGQLPSKADAKEARKLADDLRELRDQAAKAAGEAKPDAKAQAEQAAEQKKLAEKAGELAKKMDGAAHGATQDEPSATKLSEAAQAAKKAQEQMEKAGREQAAGHGPGAAEARTEAGKALEQAQAKAKAAAGAAGRQPDPKSAAASKLVEDANGLLREAGQQPGREGGPLKKASEKIGEAANKLGEAGQKPSPGQPEGNDGTASKPLTTEELPPDLQQYAGKPWGDLPGDVKVRIIQDLKAKYGEDYARVIKLYFEHLAEKK